MPSEKRLPLLGQPQAERPMDLLVVTLVEPCLPIDIKIIQRPARALRHQRLQLMGQLLIDPAKEPLDFPFLM